MSKNNNSDFRNSELARVTVSGENSVSTDELLSDSEVLEWEFDERSLFRTVSHSIYSNDSAGITEPTLNAVSSALLAERKYGIDPHVGVYVYAGDNPGDPVTVVIRDNGIGIDEETLREGLLYVGKSQNRWVADVMGKFGFGFLASFRLVTEKGVFFMHTKSRETDEEYRGVWSSKGFEIDNGGDLPEKFSENEYGTRLEFPVKDDINRYDIRSWVEKIATWARVEVEYKETGFDETVNDRSYKYRGRDPDNVHEIFEPRNLDDKYSESETVLTIEHESFVAKCGPDVDGKCICLDAPIKCGRESTVSAPFNIDIRFFHENGVIIEGPNKGLIPISKSELEDIPEKFRDDFILETEVEEDDIQLPYPTGNREQLAKVPEFWDWLHTKFNRKIETSVQNAVSEFEQGKSPHDIDSKDFSLMIDYLKENKSYRVSIKDVISNLGASLTDEQLLFLETMMQRVKLVDSSTQNINRPRTQSKRFYQVLMMQKENGGDVYSGVSLNKKKAEVVWEDSEENMVVKIDGSDGIPQDCDSVNEVYSLLDEYLDWSPLKDISGQTIEEFDVSESTIQEMKGGRNRKSDTIEKRELTLHYTRPGSDSRSTTKMKVGEIVEEKGENEETFGNNHYGINRIILFPSTSDEHISDNYELVSDSTAIARCTKKVAEYMKNTDGIVDIDSFTSEGMEMEVETSDGRRSVAALDSEDERVLFHVIPEGIYNEFIESEYIDYYCEFFEEGKESSVQYRGSQDYLYVPVLETTYEKIVAVKSHYDMNPRVERIDMNVATKMYAYARLYERREEDAVEAIIRNPSEFDRGGKEIVDALVENSGDSQ